MEKEICSHPPIFALVSAVHKVLLLVLDQLMPAKSVYTDFFFK